MDKPKVSEPCIIIFDGACNLCHGAVAFILQRDSRAYFLFTAMQSDAAIALRAYYAIATPTQENSIVFIQQGQVLLASDAVLAIAKELDGFWPMLSVFKYLPQKLRDALYYMLASRRYRLFGKRQCQLSQAKFTLRFIESADDIPSALLA
jgi:predicted DCC family thiol-disulfide oxidoreductase YuxK